MTTNLFRVSPPTAAACPDWCTQQAGHAFDQMDNDGAEVRQHVREHGDEPGTGSLSADVVQLVRWHEGVEDQIEPVGIQVWVAGNAAEDHITNAEDARRLAAYLMDAADTLEAIQGRRPMSAETIARVQPTPVTGPIRCASWCEDGDGHARASYQEDQRCASVDGVVVVSLGESCKWSDGTTRPAEVRVYASQDPGESPRVTLVDPEDRGVELTREEALELARQLKHFAWVADQDSCVRNAFELGHDAGTMGLVSRSG